VVPVNPTHRNSQDNRLLDALSAGNSSTRLQAALAAGTQADPGLAEVLVTRCAIEPDFFVRDMLTWALTRLPAEITVPRLVTQLRSESAQARSQALHTLSKIGDGSTWPAITRSLLHDADDEVARSAWRAAVVLVPAGERTALAAELATQLGRGDRTVRLSLSRALVALGDVIEPALRTGLASDEPAVRAHARATERLLRDPDAGFDEARRFVALGPERAAEIEEAVEVVEVVEVVDTAC
jgi:HEAT repeat protein